MSSIFCILLKESILKTLKNVFTFSFYSFHIQRVKPRKTNFCMHVLQLKETGISVFQSFLHKKWPGAKEKIKLPFSRSLLKITYFQKSHTCVGCFGLLTKLKRCMELVFTAGFLYTFSIKMFLIRYPISFNN